MVPLIITNLILLLCLAILFRKYNSGRHERKSFLKLINNTNIGYYRYRTRDGVILNANEGVVKILETAGTSRDITGRSISELIIYVDGEGSIRERLKTKKFLSNIEYRFRTLKGKDKWVIHNSRLIVDPVTREQVIDVLVQDITDEKAAYEKMKGSQERYEKLFKSSGDMVVVYDLDSGIIEEINPITESLTGYSLKELIGSHIEGIIHPSYRKRMQVCRQDLLFKGVAVMESVLVCRNGEYREVMITLSIVALEKRNLVMGLIKDVSVLVREKEDHKRRKKELEDFCAASAKREDRIQDLKKELDRVKQQLRTLKNMSGKDA